MSDEKRQAPENSIPGQNRGIDDGIVNNPSHALHGIPVLHTFELLHRSHSGLSGVKVFDEMIEWAREGRYRFLLVDKFDRFGRNLYEAIVLERELNELGVFIVSAKEQFDASSPSGWFAKTMMQVSADFYARNLATETRKGTREKLERGEWPGRPPLGYNHLETRDRETHKRPRSLLLEDETFGPMIRRAFVHFASGRYTLKEWEQKAHELGMHGRTGNRIHQQVWAKIFHNPLYVGKMRTGMFPDMEFEAHADTPRLATMEVFERVQRVLEDRWNGAGRHDKFRYPLRPILWSAEGDCQMWGETQEHKGISYYRTREPVHGRRIYIPRPKVEAAFALLLDNLALGSDAAASIQAALLTQVAHEHRGKEDETATLQKREKRLRDAGRNLIRMHSMGDISYEDFQAERRLNASALREVQDKLGGLRGPVEERLSDLQLAARLMAKLGDLWRELDNDDDREHFACLIFKRVVIQRSGVIHSWKLAEPFAELYKLSLGRETTAGQLRLRFPERWRIPPSVVESLGKG